MPSRACFARHARLMTSTTTHAIAQRRVCQTHARFFSEQSQSPLDKGKEKAHAHDTPNGSSEGKEKKERSAHALFYSDTLPAMIPIALLGSAVYIGLQLVQTKLATEKYLDEANARIAQLEEEVERLQSAQEARSSVAPESSDGTSRVRSRWWWFV